MLSKQQKVFAVMYRKISRISLENSHIPITAKRFTQDEKKLLSGASQIPKNCMGFAIAACAALQKLPSNACLQQPFRT